MYRLGPLLLFSSVCAQIYLNKTCNFTQLLKPVNTTTISGRWYQLERIDNTFESADCSTITFTIILKDGKPIDIEVSNKEVSSGEVVFRNATVSFSETYFGVQNFTFANGESYDYVIMSVTPYQYESMVLYSCQNNGNTSLVWAWKLGKTLIQSAEARNATEILVAGIEDLANATWRTTSFSETACKVNDAEEFNFFMPILIFSCIFVILCLCLNILCIYNMKTRSMATKDEKKKDTRFSSTC